MKLSKAQFKKILKECIVELIDEGAFNKVVNENITYQAQRPASDDFVDQSSHEAGNAPVGTFQSPNERLRELAKQTAQRAAGGDSKQAAMLENIFADTARNTYQRQISEDGGALTNPGAVYTGQQADPEAMRRDKAQLQSLHKGNASHWAKLAFGKYNKK